MADLVISIHEYIGDSYWNWEYDIFERASNCDDLRRAVEYAGYAGQVFDRIVLEIGNCYGGSVYEGLAMFHYLQGLNVPILTRILGTVASMGTVVPLAGDEIECAQTSQWMVHAPSNEFWGTAAEIKAGLKGLDGDTQAISDVYIARTGADAATVAGWLSQDTWLTAAEALAAGLCTSVMPLRPKTAPAAPVLNEAQARARRTRFAEAVARADKRAPSSVKTPAAPAEAASAPAPKPAPMATVKPTPRAAKPAAKPQARKTLFTKLMEALGIDEDGEETEDPTAEATAAVESTDLDGGAKVYHDGAIVVGTTAIFNDEALTEATPDGDYDTADSQVLTVAGGICTALGPEPAATTTTTETAAVAALRKEFEVLKGKLSTAEAELQTLKKIKPPMPTARGGRPNADAPDPKAQAKTKQPVEGAGTL